MQHQILYEQDNLTIRNYQFSDCKALTELFYHTVHTINARDYTSEQLHAWADGHVDLDKWNQSLLEHYTLVAEVLIADKANVPVQVDDSVSASTHDEAHLSNNLSSNLSYKRVIVGFGDVVCLDDVEHTGQIGYLDRLYVHADYQRQGIASRLCDLLESAVLKNSRVELSTLKDSTLDISTLKNSELERLASGTMTSRLSILKPPASNSEKSNGTCGVLVTQGSRVVIPPALGVIVTHASITARPFFEKRGYKVKKEQSVIRHGVALKNFVMEKAFN